MNEIRIIPRHRLNWYVISAKKPYMPLATFLSAFTKFLFLLLLCVFCLFFPILMLNEGEPIAALISMGVGLFIASYFFPFIGGGGIYKPGKSFVAWRKTKEQIYKQQKRIGIITTLLVIPIALVMYICESNIKTFYYLAVAVLGGLGTIIYVCYFLKKNFAFHEDVDFVLISDVSRLLGFDIDEKIQASYYNKYDDTVLLLTNKKLMYAFWNNGERFVMTKSFDEISRIGVYNGSYLKRPTGNLYLLIEFSDSSVIEEKMQEFDFTSNPDLFFKKFLLTLDNYLTNDNVATTTNSSRRRVSVGNSAEYEKQQEDVALQMRKRVIDVSESIIQGFNGAISVENNRKLEL